MSATHALYRFYATDGALLYVGITADPGARWRKHAHDKPWWQEVANITVELHPSRRAVLEAERASIITEKPRYNVVHNRGTSAEPRAVAQLDRLAPFQVGDWVALGLTDGRCPVGEIAAYDDTWVSLRLKDWLSGTITNHAIAVRWTQIERVELAYPEDGTTDRSGPRIMDDEHLGDFQTAWRRVRLGEHKDPIDEAVGDVRREKHERKAATPVTATQLEPPFDPEIDRPPVLDPDTPPNSRDAEQALLGTLMVNPDMAPLAATLIDRDDIYRPEHQVIWDSIHAVTATGALPEPALVLDHLTRVKELNKVGGAPYLFELVQAGRFGQLDEYARIVRDTSRLRSAQEATSKVRSAIRSARPENVTDAIEAAVTVMDQELVRFGASTNQRIRRHVETIDELLHGEDDDTYDWVIPGLLERQERVIITAEEGAGKSTLLRQIAVQAAAGIHPFTLETIAPITVLHIDVENTRRQSRRRYRPLRLQAGHQLESDRLRIELRTAGLDLTTDTDRDWLLDTCRHVQPDLLLIGPIYNSPTATPPKRSPPNPSPWPSTRSATRSTAPSSSKPTPPKPPATATHANAPTSPTAGPGGCAGPRSASGSTATAPSPPGAEPAKNAPGPSPSNAAAPGPGPPSSPTSTRTGTPSAAPDSTTASTSPSASSSSRPASPRPRSNASSAPPCPTRTSGSPSTAPPPNGPSRRRCEHQGRPVHSCLAPGHTQQDSTPVLRCPETPQDSPDLHKHHHHPPSCRPTRKTAPTHTKPQVRRCPALSLPTGEGVPPDTHPLTRSERAPPGRRQPARPHGRRPPMTDPTNTPRCTATAKGSGERCKRRPIPGGTVCVKHGGGAPAVRAAAEQRLLERHALVAAESFGLPREVDPHTALLEELHRTAGAVQWLGAIVADLENDAIVWGKVKETHGTQLEKGTDNGTTKAAQVNVFVRLWQEERDRLAKVAKTCVDVGIEERRVRLAESTGQQLAAFARSLLDRMFAALVEAIGVERATESRWRPCGLRQRW